MRRHRTITDREYAGELRIRAADPDNQSGADKTWVLHFLRSLERVFNNAHPAAKKRRQTQPSRKLYAILLLPLVFVCIQFNAETPGKERERADALVIDVKPSQDRQVIDGF